MIAVDIGRFAGGRDIVINFARWFRCNITGDILGNDRCRKK